MDRSKMIDTLRQGLAAQARKEEAYFERGVALLESLSVWPLTLTATELRRLQDDLNAAGNVLRLLICQNNAESGQN